MPKVDRAGLKCRQPPSELCSGIWTGQPRHGRGFQAGVLSRGGWLCILSWRAGAGPTLWASPVDIGLEGLVIVSNKVCGRGSEDVNGSLCLSPAGSWQLCHFLATYLGGCPVQSALTNERLRQSSAFD